MSSQFSISDSEATTSEAPSAFMNEDDSIMSESVDIMGSGRSARSLNSEYSGADVMGLNNDSSMQRLVDNLNDMDNQFGSLLNSQTTGRMSTNSQATAQDSDLQSLQDELNGARLSSPANSILVETVDEESCHQTGMMNASLRRMPSAGASSLSNIREEGENNNHNYGGSPAFDNNIQESHRSQQSREPPVVETVDEESCHESGLFSSNRRNSTDTNSTGMSGDHQQHPPQEEFDPSYYKKRETQPPTPQAYDGYETTSTAGGFSNSEGMGAATTEHQWDNLQSTLDQQTDEVRNSPYYSTPPGKEAPFSPTGSDPPNTEGLRRELDSAALAPPVAANRDVENNNGTYWQGDKAYDENYDDEHLDVSPGGAQTANNGKNNSNKNPTQSSNALRNFVGDEAKYQMVVKSLAGCICCMIIWTLAMVIVLATK